MITNHNSEEDKVYYIHNTNTTFLPGVRLCCIHFFPILQRIFVHTVNRLALSIVAYLVLFSEYGVWQPTDIKKGFSKKSVRFSNCTTFLPLLRHFKSASVSITFLHNYQKSIIFSFSVFPSYYSQFSVSPKITHILNLRNI